MSARRWCTPSLVLLFMVASHAALAGEFSAQLVVAFRDRPPVTVGAIYVKGQNMRKETYSRGKVQQVIIVNAKRLTSWMVSPPQRTAEASPTLTQQQLTSLEGMLRGRPVVGPPQQGWVVKQLGTETVNGYLCEKTQVTSTDGEHNTTVWYSKKLDIAVRTDMSMSSGGQVTTGRQEYRNIRERKLPDSLFLPPPGYTQVTPKAPAPAPEAGSTPPASRGR